VCVTTASTTPTNI